MTTMLVIDESLCSYIFIGDSKEIKETMREAYATDPSYRKMIDNMRRYARFQEGLDKFRKFTRRVFGLEDKL